MGESHTVCTNCLRHHRIRKGIPLSLARSPHLVRAHSRLAQLASTHSLTHVLTAAHSLARLFSRFLARSQNLRPLCLPREHLHAPVSCNVRTLNRACLSTGLTHECFEEPFSSSTELHCQAYSDPPGEWSATLAFIIMGSATLSWHHLASP